VFFSSFFFSFGDWRLVRSAVRDTEAMAG